MTYRDFNYTDEYLDGIPSGPMTVMILVVNMDYISELINNSTVSWLVMIEGMTSHGQMVC